MAENSLVIRPQAFDAGQARRRLRSIPSAANAINQQIKQYGATVVARSRYLVLNNSYAETAREEFVASLVGDGIKPASLISDRETREQVHEAFLAWTDEADADWLTDFYGLQSMIAGEMFEAGECFIRIRNRRPEDGLTVPLQLQLIPSEMLPLTDNRERRGGGTSARIEMGIEFDALGRRVAYHFLKEHPGSGRMMMAGDNTSRVPAEEILHLFRPRIAGQIRGIPHTISAVAKLAMMDQYDDAELERKRTAALFGGFVTRADALPEDGSPLPGILGTAEDMGLGPLPDMEPGAMVALEPGEDIKFAEPADVGGNYETFQYRTLTAIAAGMGVPYSAMTGDLRQTSYSSIRSGLVGFKRRISALQHHVMIYQFCRPVWARWMQEAILAGVVPVSLNAPPEEQARLSRAKWQPPKWEWVDPLKDIRAEQMAVESGFKARSDVVEALGFDPEEVDRRIAADKEREEALGLNFGARSDPAPGEIFGE